MFVVTMQCVCDSYLRCRLVNKFSAYGNGVGFTLLVLQRLFSQLFINKYYYMFFHRRKFSIVLIQYKNVIYNLPIIRAHLLSVLFFWRKFLMKLFLQKYYFFFLEILNKIDNKEDCNFYFKVRILRKRK